MAGALNEGPGVLTVVSACAAVAVSTANSSGAMPRIAQAIRRRMALARLVVFCVLVMT